MSSSPALPLSNRLLKVFQLSSNFREAVRVVGGEAVPALAPEELLLRNLYVGVNATDLNITSGRYFKHGPIPYPLGIEVFAFVFSLNFFISI